MTVVDRSILIDYERTITNMALKHNKMWSWMVGGTAVMALLLFIVQLTQKNTLKDRLASIRNQGFPTSLEELDASYPAVPDHENAAILFQEAVDAHVPASNNLDIVPTIGAGQWPDPGSPFQPEMKSAIFAYLTANKATLETIHQASKLKRSRYPIDLKKGASLLLPHMASLRDLSKLLRVETGFHSLSGNQDLAVRSIMDTFAVAHSLADEPLLISALVRIAILSIALDGLEQTLSAGSLTESQVHSLTTAIEQMEAEGRRAYTRAIAGERSFGISFFDESPAKQANVFPGNQSFVPQKVFLTLFKLSGLHHKDLRFFLRTFDDMMKAVQQPFPDSLRATREATARMDKEFGTLTGRLMLISRNILPAMGRAIEKEAQLTARLRAARTALAVEQFRRAHEDELPEDLTALVPRFLENLPADPFDGIPLALEFCRPVFA